MHFIIEKSIINVPLQEVVFECQATGAELDVPRGSIVYFEVETPAQVKLNRWLKNV